jgi:hypothetical protein
MKEEHKEGEGRIRGGRGEREMKEGGGEGEEGGTDCSRLRSRKCFLFQILTAIHVSHRRHVPAANILIEGNRMVEHCASHKPTNKQKSVRKGKVGMKVVVFI